MLFFRPARCRTLADVSAQPHVARPARGSRCRLRRNFLLRRFGEGLPTAEAFWKGAVYALVIAFCWALACGPPSGPELSDDDGRQDGEAVGNVGSRAAWRGRGALLRIAAGGVRPGLLVPDFGNAGRRMFAGRGFGGILLKAMAVAAVVVPAWLIRDAVNG